MQRAKIRRYVLVIVVVLAAASMFPSLGSSSHRSAPPPARHTTLVAKHQGVPATGQPGHVTPVRDDP
jgi:hypothetical protein